MCVFMFVYIICMRGFSSLPTPKPLTWLLRRVCYRVTDVPVHRPCQGSQWEWHKCVTITKQCQVMTQWGKAVCVGTFVICTEARSCSSVLLTFTTKVLGAWKCFSSKYKNCMRSCCFMSMLWQPSACVSFLWRECVLRICLWSTLIGC